MSEECKPEESDDLSMPVPTIQACNVAVDCMKLIEQAYEQIAGLQETVNGLIGWELDAAASRTLATVNGEMREELEQVVSRMVAERN